MIISDALDKNIVSLIHDIIQLDAIYIFGGNRPGREQWGNEWPKFKGIFTQMSLMCECLQQTARRCDQDSITLSFAPVSSTASSQHNHDKLDQSFMYTQLLKEIFLEIGNFGPQAIQELGKYCREQSVNTSDIAKVEQEYCDHTPIWWYTAPYFLYPMLNRALRILEVDMILKMGFFICDLHRRIQQLHSEQSVGQQECFTVYRGQELSQESFEKMMQIKDGLMAFNNFLSTSTDREISFAFAHSNSFNLDLIGILFEISIDSRTSSAPFVHLTNDMTYFPTEEEVLFLMHTVFRIGEIEQIEENNRLWQVKLAVTSDNDPQLCTLTERIRQELGDSAGWSRLGILLGKLGQSDKAEEVYQMLLDQETNDSEKATLYNNLGFSKCLQANEIQQRSLPANHPDLAASYNLIGLVYGHMGEYSKALSFYEKANEIWQKSSSPSHPDLATSYSNIGSAYDSIAEYSTALLFYEKALAIREKTLPPCHPNLATSCNNIGAVYDITGEYAKALSFYEKALEILEKTLPSNHPNLATFYSNIGLVYDSMKEYSKAFSFYEKALEIREKTLPPDHADLAYSYNNIGLLYEHMGACPTSLSFYEIANEIYQKRLPSNHPDLAASYYNIGVMYKNMREFEKAFTFCERAVIIGQSSLRPNHPNLKRFRDTLEYVKKKL
ncbi:unnamed protein product [Rotaria socialis]|nr:unnamed protein product [Rotaria socialis]CAF3438011.1 unnamed protein product [Rotaria socialis]